MTVKVLVLYTNISNDNVRTITFMDCPLIMHARFGEWSPFLWQHQGIPVSTCQLVGALSLHSTTRPLLGPS